MRNSSSLRCISAICSRRTTRSSPLAAGLVGGGAAGLAPGMNALAKLAETNMAMFRAAASAFMPGGAPPPSKPAAKSEEDLDALRKQMAEMQKKLDELSK